MLQVYNYSCFCNPFIKVEDNTKPSLMSTNKSNDQPDSDFSNTFYKGYGHDDHQVDAALSIVKDYG